mmetsp:Transcript_153633/g.492436  ORF Transcript_153633/g.492436 Transcript_153633/m.492436 type:complete len:362 (+) Transcript_153633:120-1205(+)
MVAGALARRDRGFGARRAAPRPLTLCLAAATAAAAAVVAGTATRFVLLDGQLASTSAFVATSAAAGSQLRAGDADAARGRVVMAASAVRPVINRLTTRRQKEADAEDEGITQKYLLLKDTDEFRDVVASFQRLDKAGSLQEFLNRVIDWLDGKSMYELANDDKVARRMLALEMKKDWLQLWPKASEGEGLRTYESVSMLYKRFESSRIWDFIEKKVLPANEDQGVRSNVLVYTEDQQIDIMEDRVVDSKLVRLLADASSEEPELLALGSKVFRPFARWCAALRVKGAIEPEAPLPLPLLGGLVFLLFSVFTALGMAAGVVPNPFQEAEAPSTSDSMETIAAYRAQGDVNRLYMEANPEKKL